MAQICTPVSNPGTLTAASPSTSCTGTFNTNINYGGPTTPPPSLLTLTLQPGGVIVNSPGGNAVNLANVTGLINPPAIGTSATILANDATITNTSNPGGPNQSALHIQAAGDAIIGTLTDPVSGIINVTGTNSTNAIFATVFSSVAGAVASVNYDGPAIGPGITATGTANSTLIQACANDACGFGNLVDADANIVAAGNLKGTVGTDALAAGLGITGLFAGRGGASAAMRPCSTVAARST